MTSECPDYAAMARALVRGDLATEGFSHRAHVAVAYEILSRHEVFEAIALYAKGLRRLTRAAGTPEKFNATVTFAFMSLIATRMAETPQGDSEAFLKANPDLLDRAILAPYFRPDCLASDLARRVPLIADRTMAAGARSDIDPPGPEDVAPADVGRGIETGSP